MWFIPRATNLENITGFVRRVASRHTTGGTNLLSIPGSVNKGPRRKIGTPDAFLALCALVCGVMAPCNPTPSSDRRQVLGCLDDRRRAETVGSAPEQSWGRLIPRTALGLVRPARVYVPANADTATRTHIYRIN